MLLSRVRGGFSLEIDTVVVAVAAGSVVSSSFHLWEVMETNVSGQNLKQKRKKYLRKSLEKFLMEW